MSSHLHPLIERAASHGVVLEMKGAVAVVRLCRPAKRYALSDSLIEALRDVFQNLPSEARAAVVHGEIRAQERRRAGATVREHRRVG